MNIRNIIFDFGGVIMNIDYGITIKKLLDAGVNDTETLHQKIIEKDLYNGIETGKISPQQFRDGLKEIINIPISDEQIDDIWNALVLDIPVSRVRLLEAVKKHYRIFMLSNTNSIHYDKYRQQLEDQYGYERFSDLFDEAYFSHLMGYRKPDQRIFHHVIEKEDLNPDQTLFIDDTRENALAAKEAGLKAYHLDLEKGEDVTDLFNDGKLVITAEDIV
ncbi:MAG: HAD family phosphatase [Bacteroidales bacterium]|nr:HAD family phosphatase [Bacteroidales bacterium]MCF8345064.1 HAD family phosphatase [Bacteroidales bacterium]MCF8377632.1 HAD family phosphatase [Bacteroidales bacterium]MCF8402024.1 HAD family phosphatase [Bacteroidales bacterium]